MTFIKFCRLPDVDVIHSSKVRSHVCCVVFDWNFKPQVNAGLRGKLILAVFHPRCKEEVEEGGWTMWQPLHPNPLYSCTSFGDWRAGVRSSCCVPKTNYKDPGPPPGGCMQGRAGESVIVSIHR
ncbi:unnamed protein product [Pleuronectes platessa]|uniref:Uncharacterized protein n=1 Tax=Pleuronectes platessa TaxID=8262 RepID=A0A9N7TYJ0_PLEPL|nr:unnamed protein product [Pleuronectes platessa]